MESYLLKSSLLLAILYVFYLLILKDESNHQLKRFIGLACVIFSSCFLLIPADSVEISEEFPTAVQTVLESSSYVQRSISNVVFDNPANWYLIVYFMGVGVFSIRSLAGLITLIGFYVKSEKSKRWGFKVVAPEQSISPFTFFNILFISKQDIEADSIDALVRHEQLHRDQLHSFDTILFEFLTILFWFNPAIWLFQRDIKAEHEYLADEYVLRKGFDRLNYQHLLFKARTGISFWSGSHLSYSTSLKKRFKMMENEKRSARSSYFRAAVFLPLTIVLALIVSSSPLVVNGQSNDGIPNFRLYYGDEKVDWSREVDLEKGVSPATRFIHAVVKDTGALQIRVSLLYVTHIRKGLSTGQMRAGGRIPMGSFFGNVEAERGDRLIVEIVQYQTRNAEGKIETRDLEHSKVFSFPVLF